MTFPPCRGGPSGRELEGVKRAREEYQILLCEHPRTKAQRIGADSLPVDATSSDTAQCSARASGTPQASVDLPDQPGGCTVFPRPSTVELTRADTGRTFAFVFSPTITYAWRRRSDRNRSHADERVGYELQEVVRASVSRRSTNAPARLTAVPSVASPLSCTPTRAHGGDSFFDNEENDDSQQFQPLSECRRTSGLSRRDGANVSPPYFFELSQVSRTLQPPPLVSCFNSVRDGEAVLHSHTTQALLVDGLLRCAAEEAQLSDAAAWAFLYKGRHLHTEAGRNLLGRDLLLRTAHHCDSAWKRDKDGAPIVALCALRKF